MQGVLVSLVPVFKINFTSPILDLLGPQNSLKCIFNVFIYLVKHLHTD